MERTDEFIERKIITGLIVSNDYIKHIARIYKPDFLVAHAAKLLAGWCLEYFKQYGKAPGRDIEGIFALKVKEGIPKERAEDIEDILSSLSEEYEQQESFNVNYLLDTTIKHFQESQAKALHEQQGQAIKSGDMDKFYELQNTFQPVTLSENESINAGELYQMEDKKMDWLVKDLIPIGLTILGGKSKVGKSYFILNLAMALAQGKPMFGGDNEEGFRGRRGQILYLSLEDPKDRFKRRMHEIDPEPDLTLLDKNLSLRFQHEKLLRGGHQAITQWVEKSKAHRLVIIDTLAKVWSKKSSTGGGGLYAEEYLIYSPLADLAHQHRISIILITHTIKGKAPDVFDEILGGMGTQGPADNLIVLSNDTGGKKRLSIKGKDIEEKHYIFSTSVESPGCWTFEGEAGEIQKSEQRQALYKLIEEEGHMKYQDIKLKVKECGVGISPNSVNTVLRKMVADGTLEQSKQWGEYAIAGYNDKQVNATVVTKSKRLRKTK